MKQRIEQIAPDQWQELAQQLLRVRRPVQAEEIVRRQLSQQPRDAFAYVLLAMTLARQERLVDAQVAVQQGIALNPRLSSGHYVLSVILHHSKQPDAALQAVREALRLDAGNAYYFGWQALLLNGRQQSEEALCAAARGLALDPANDECLCQRVQALRRLRRAEEAWSTIQQLRHQHPLLPAAHLFSGEEALERQDFSEAEQQFREVLRLEPTHTQAQALLRQAEISAFWWHWPLIWAARWKANMERRGRTTHLTDKVLVTGQALLYCIALLPLCCSWLLAQALDWRQRQQAVAPTPSDAWFFGGMIWGLLTIISAALLPPWLVLAYVLVGGGLLFPLRNSWLRRYRSGESRFPLGVLLLLSPGSSALLNLYGFWGNPDPITEYREFLTCFGVFLIVYQLFRPGRRPLSLSS